MRKILVSFGVLAAGLSAASHAQSWADQVWMQLQDQYMYANDDGYESVNFMIGRLAEGEKFTWSLDLEEGLYEIRAACDGDCMDVDLRFFEDETEVDSDTATDYAPVMNIEVMRSGMYDIEVEMYDCSSEPCYYGIGVFHQQTSAATPL